MADIFPEHIREWIAKMQREGQSAWTIQYCKRSILSSIFTTALNDQVTHIHPCRGVKIPTVPDEPRTIITPEQFEAIYEALPGADAQLLVETAIETGLRWGELAELRVGDLDATRMLTVSRKVIEGNAGARHCRRAFADDRAARKRRHTRWRRCPASRHTREPCQQADSRPGQTACQGSHRHEPGMRRSAALAGAPPAANTATRSHHLGHGLSLHLLRLSSSASLAQHGGGLGARPGAWSPWTSDSQARRPLMITTGHGAWCTQC